MLSQLDQTQMGLQNLGWKSAIGQQIGSGFIDNYADKQVQKRVREIEARTRLQNLVSPYRSSYLEKIFEDRAAKQVQNKEKEIEARIRLQNLDQDIDLQNLGWVGVGAKVIGGKFQNLDQDIDLQNLGWAGAIGQQIGSSFLDNYADQQVQKRVKEIERMTRLQNLGFKGIAKGYATDAVNGKLGNIKNNQVQNRVKQIEAMTRLQNLETAAESRERLMQCPEGQHW